MYGKQQLGVINQVTFNLICGEGVTELQNLTNLCLSSFAESHQMQQKNFDVSPYVYGPYSFLYVQIEILYLLPITFVSNWQCILIGTLAWIHQFIADPLCLPSCFNLSAPCQRCWLAVQRRVLSLQNFFY